MVFNQEMDGNGRISAVKCRPKVWISLQIQPRCPIPFQPHSAIVAPSTEFRLCTGQLQTPRDPLCESQGSRALRPASAMDVGKPIQLSRWKMWKEGECDGNWRSSCKISCGSANLPETGSSSMTMNTLGDWNSDVFQWKREGLFYIEASISSALTSDPWTHGFAERQGLVCFAKTWGCLGYGSSVKNHSTSGTLNLKQSRNEYELPSNMWIFIIN